METRNGQTETHYVASLITCMLFTFFINTTYFMCLFINVWIVIKLHSVAVMLFFHCFSSISLNFIAPLLDINGAIVIIFAFWPQAADQRLRFNLVALLFFRIQNFGFHSVDQVVCVRLCGSAWNKSDVAADSPWIVRTRTCPMKSPPKWNRAIKIWPHVKLLQTKMKRRDSLWPEIDGFIWFKWRNPVAVYLAHRYLVQFNESMPNGRREESAGGRMTLKSQKWRAFSDLFIFASNFAIRDRQNKCFTNDE